MPMQSVNPATGEQIAEFEEMSGAAVKESLDEATVAFERWRREPLAQRTALLKNAAAVLRRNAASYARLITLEMGKPITQSLAEVEKCAWNCEFYAENAERFLADIEIATNARTSYVAFDPLGPVLAIMPWNFPFWQVFRFAAPALAAGNTALLKHASNVPQCALAIEAVFREAGFPAGVFRTLLIGSGAVEGVIADSRVRAVTLTGSAATGRQVAAAAGRALKKAVLELGGSDAFIVLADADLDAAAQTAATARNQNTGQSCIAAKRFIVEASVAAEFERKFIEAVRCLKLGDPMQEATQVGPMARGDLRDELARQVRASVQQGAATALGGAAPPGAGYYYQPTVLTSVTREMAVWREETFGPVAAVIRARDGAEAVMLANDSEYGLGASLWTGDLARGQQLARQIEAGSVFINGMVASDPRLPFGGIKDSGYGRELSEFGIREFVNIKTVWVGAPSGSQSPQTPSE